jgi:TonB family protein
MHETHERTRMMSLRLPRAWFARAVVVLALVSCHVVLFYGISQTRALKSSADGPPMFGPVVLNKWRDLHQRYVTSRPSSEPMQEDQSIPPSRHWKFPPIDIWPSSASRPATLSRFTPVTDAQPDPTDTLTAQEGIANKPPVRLSTLRMVRWLRPDYPIEWAVAGMDGSVLLDPRIDAHGQPVRTNVARSSGSPQLDEAALHAANAWRFAPRCGSHRDRAGPSGERTRSSLTIFPTPRPDRSRCAGSSIESSTSAAPHFGRLHLIARAGSGG